MRRLPPEPQVGDRVTAELVRELIRCIRERQLLKGPNYSISTGPNGTHLKLDLPQRQNFPRKPLPYEVRFDATLDSGDGGWKIYLPTEHLLSYDGEDIDTSDITGVTAIEDANGDATGWYSFDDVDLQAEHVWLVVTITDPASGSSSPTVEAEFAASEGQASTGEKVVNVCIAEISYTASSQSGDPATIEIKQSVVGAVHLGGEGGGGGGGDEGHPEPFDIDGDKVVRCNIPAPEAILTCGDYTINPQLGDIYVHVDRQTNGYVLSVDQASRISSATHAQWLLYNYVGGNITCDCRPKVLPLFDLS